LDEIIAKGEFHMKNNRIFTLCLICLLLLGIVVTGSAQNKRIGTAAAPELLIPVGARDLAMAGSSMAVSEGVEAIHWNPAGLGKMTSSAEAMFSNMSYIADIGVNYGAVAGSFGQFGTVALSIKSINFGDINITTVDDPDGVGGRVFSPAFVTVGLSFARSLTDAISAGGTVKLVSEQIHRVSASGVAFDFGVQYNRLGGIPGFSVGVAVKNIGGQMKFDGSGLLRDAIASDAGRGVQKFKSEAASFELPSTIEIGLSYQRNFGDNFGALVNGTFINNNLFLDEYRLGTELEYKFESLSLFARTGVAVTPKDQNAEQENVFGACFGGGVTTNAAGINITLDYAYRSAQFFNANHVFSLKFGF
jgi:hypothetical protein